MSPVIIRYSDDFPPGAQMGGKAGALAALASAGLPIPEWFVITPAAFEKGDDAGEFRLDATLAREIVTAARELAPGTAWFAVRSSALDERSIPLPGNWTAFSLSRQRASRKKLRAYAGLALASESSLTAASIISPADHVRPLC
jgi:hypothetical protein